MNTDYKKDDLLTLAKFNINKKIAELADIDFNNQKTAIIVPAKDDLLSWKQTQDASYLMHHIAGSVENGFAWVLEADREIDEQFDYVTVPHDFLDFDQESMIERLRKNNKDIQVI